MDDAQLLQQYADEGSEAAFQTLVRRHLGLVHGAALRQVGDPSLAQDVAQAVFLLLARKAGRLGRGVVVAGWLYRTTGFVASRVRRSEQRRRQREQEALDMSQLQSTDEVWKRLSPELDEALSRLGETDRNVILLRFGSGRSHREVGDALGLSEEAVRKRAHRSLGVLRDLLIRSGVTVSVGMLSTLLVERISAQPPPELEPGILVGVRDGVAASGRVGDIARDTVAAWRSAWIPWAAVVGFAVLVFLGVLTRSSQSVRSEPGGNAPSVAATTPGLPGNAVPSGAAAAAPGAVFRLKVTSAVDGTPLPGVPVVARMVVGRDWTSRDDLVTAADGVEHTVVLRPVPSVRGTVVDAVTHSDMPSFKAIPASGGESFDRSALRYGAQGNYELPFLEGAPRAVLIEAEGYESAVAEPRQVNGVLRCDVALKPWVHSGPIRGVVRTPAGEPASGVDVALLTLERSASWLASGRLKMEPEGLVFRTDAEGRFEIPRDSRAHSVVASGADGFARIRVRDFGADLTVTLEPWGRIEAEGAAGGSDHVLGDAEGAGSACGISVYWQARATPEGLLVVDRVPAGPYVLRDRLGRGCPTLVRVRAGATSRVRLEAGRTVTGRVATNPGEPVLVDGRTVLVGRLGSRGPQGLGIPNGPVLELAEWHRQAEAWESPEVQASLAVPVVVSVSVSPDGSFRAEGVPPGSYVLTVNAREASAAGPPSERAFHADLEIPPGDGDEGSAYDAGVVTVRTADKRAR